MGKLILLRKLAFFYILLTVPAAPQNVNVFSPCSTCLTVTWDPVYTSPTDTLTAYHVVYKDASGKAYMKKIGSRKSIAQLTSLEKFSTYTVTVTAMTDGGLGETSTAVIVTTMEDGEFFFSLCVCFFYYYYLLFNGDENGLNWYRYTGTGH